ncbi:DUF2634 domain-containing protein [Mahella australiensis]|uniref:DUF2634 domain-containing protein n=1 Tax=Mahella australiensis (strain DSM 15567 / CIP 107919 / 50-1 BON) TaxID=697281 RepID=F3ZZX5_MAHA5|nr:DUF2634 domain-containing protein [Mahella australiensis]AEE95793.1 hypothetical protein Mahau_0590 [Mahella australiensis 50-1 BON]
MPNLFPIEEETVGEIAAEEQMQEYGRSWKFDFAKGDFVLTPAGKVMGTSGAEAWVEWCQKTIATARYRYLVYSRDYGQEFDDLISQHLTREANESEIKRITTEALMVNPLTASVDNFTFDWDHDTVYFTCEITNTRSETVLINGQVVIG